MFIELKPIDKENKQFIGKLTAPNINMRALTLEICDPIIINGGEKVKIGCMTINDHLSILDKNEDVELKIKFESTNNELEEIELSKYILC